MRAATPWRKSSPAFLGTKIRAMLAPWGVGLPRRRKLSAVAGPAVPLPLQGIRAPSSGRMAGSKRPRSNSRHYRKQFSEFEQLRFRARAMESTRVAFHSHFAQGKPVPPPDLTPFYGELDAPKGASSDSSEAVVPSQWSMWRNALPPWVRVDAVRPGLAPS
jgi:hypothetical protein